MLLILLLILAFIPTFIFWTKWKWHQEDAKLNIPGPPWVPILGNILDFWAASKQKRTMFYVLKYHKAYGDTVLIRFGSTLSVLTKDVKFQEMIANDPKFIKSDDYDVFKTWQGDSLGITHGERWHKMRKLLTPAFHFKILERYIQIFEEQSNILVKKLEALPDGVTMDPFPIFHLFSLDVISESAIGVKINCQTDPNSKFVQTNTELLLLCYERYINPLFRINWIWKLTPMYRRQVEMINYTHSFVNGLIEKRRKMLLFEQIHDVLEDNKREKPVFIDILLQSEMDGKPLSNEQIRSEVIAFMFAGHETVGSVLAFMMYELAKNPEKQEKLYEEIKKHEVLCSTEESRIKTLNSLPYLDGTIRETLRLHPIVPSVTKKCVEDFEYNGMFIPKKALIITAFYPNHMDEKYFKNSNEFLPERWTNEVTNVERNPYAYQPFSSGLRNCIGQKFAMLELKTAIIKILSQFQVELTDKDFVPFLTVAFTMRSENGFPLKFKKRE